MVKKILNQLSFRWKYAIYGALFGCCFPLFATLFDLYLNEFSVSLANIVQIQQQQPLHWIIDTAPFFLGLFASFAGIKQDHLIELNRTLEKRILERTEDLRKTNEELKNFSYIVSHDLKAPLRGISTLAMFIEEDMGELDDLVKGNFELLKSRVRRMEILINGILEYSRIGRQHTKLEIVPLKEDLQSVIDFINPPANVQISIPNHLPNLIGNRVRVQQVFQNLISNAIKYNDKPNPVIQLTVRELPDFYEFRVIDNGTGIDPRYHDKIFGMFQTLQSKDSYESTGIGLTIVKKIIEDQGGLIWIESEAGKGATFAFRWNKTIQMQPQKHNKSNPNHPVPPTITHPN